jgi:ankyrin repeat protein
MVGLRDRVMALVKSDVACLRECGAHDIALITYSSLGEERYEIADFLLGAGANVDGRQFGVTTLHLAANKGYLRLADVLLAHGADVNAIAKSRGQQFTPVAAAVKAKQEKMVEFLKSRGGREVL